MHIRLCSVLNAKLLEVEEVLRRCWNKQRFTDTARKKQPTVRLGINPEYESLDWLLNETCIWLDWDWDQTGMLLLLLLLPDHWGWTLRESTLLSATQDSGPLWGLRSTLRVSVSSLDDLQRVVGVTSKPWSNGQCERRLGLVGLGQSESLFSVYTCYFFASLSLQAYFASRKRRAKPEIVAEAQRCPYRCCRVAEFATGDILAKLKQRMNHALIWACDLYVLVFFVVIVIMHCVSVSVFLCRFQLSSSIRLYCCSAGLLSSPSSSMSLLSLHSSLIIAIKTTELLWGPLPSCSSHIMLQNYSLHSLERIISWLTCFSVTVSVLAPGCGVRSMPNLPTLPNFPGACWAWLILCQKRLWHQLAIAWKSLRKEGLVAGTCSRNGFFLLSMLGHQVILLWGRLFANLRMALTGQMLKCCHLSSGFQGLLASRLPRDLSRGCTQTWLLCGVVRQEHR